MLLEGYLYSREVEGLRVDVAPLTFGRARILVSEAGDYFGSIDGW